MLEVLFSVLLPSSIGYVNPLIFVCVCMQKLIVRNVFICQSCSSIHIVPVLLSVCYNQQR